MRKIQYQDMLDDIQYKMDEVQEEGRVQKVRGVRACAEGRAERKEESRLAKSLES